MVKLHYAITIAAPKETVWQTMLDEARFRDWASAFNPGTYFEGSWEQGREIRFLGTDPETGKKAGMFSRIHENRPYAYLSIEHLGFIDGETVDTTSDMVKKWAPAYENYTFVETNGQTELKVDLDADDAYIDHYNASWPKALASLKALVER